MLGLTLCYNRQFLQALTYKHKLVFIESVPAILIVGVNLGSDPSEKVANKDSKTFWPQSNGGMNKEKQAGVAKKS